MKSARSVAPSLGEWFYLTPERYKILFKVIINAYNRLRLRLQKISWANWMMPIVLAVIIVISFGLEIDKLGFYWDDWIFLNILSNLGTDNFVQTLGNNRPFLAVLYSITTRIFGYDPVRWQVFGFFSRWAATVILWWTLTELWKEMWPDRIHQVPWIVLIFTIYPSFLQQSIAIVYSHALLVMSIFIFSFGSMDRAVVKENWIWWTVSWLCAGFSMFAVEYFIGIELARFYIIWLIVGKRKSPGKTRLRQSIVYGIPYLIMLSVYLVWRFFLLPTANYNAGLIETLTQAPIDSFISLIQMIVTDFFEVCLIAWEPVIKLTSLIKPTAQTQHLFRWVVFSMSLFTFVYLSLVEKYPKRLTPKVATDNKLASIQQLFLGTVLIFTAGIPFWMVPLKINLSFPENRFTLPMMIGASIFFVVLLGVLFDSRRKMNFAIALLVGLSSGFHYQITESFRQEWRQQKRFIWEFAWRIPMLKPGTTVLTDDFPFPYSDDEAITAMINFAYDTGEGTDGLPYGFFFITESLGKELPGFEAGLPVTHQYGQIAFHGSTSQALVVYFPSDSCLRVLSSPQDVQGQFYPGGIPEAVQLSDLKNIWTGTEGLNQRNLKNFFGSEPAHGWCYFYQKAELARQAGDWDEVARLGDKAFEKGLSYLSPEELSPFIQGYTTTGDYERAKTLTLQAVDASYILRPDLCRIWEQVPPSDSGDDGRLDVFSSVLAALECESLY